MTDINDIIARVREELDDFPLVNEPALSADLRALLDEIERLREDIRGLCMDCLSKDSAIDDLRNQIDRQSETITRLDEERSHAWAMWEEAAGERDKADAEVEEEREALREAVDLLRELHDTHVTAFPAVANLGPIARVRTFLAKMDTKP